MKNCFLSILALLLFTAYSCKTDTSQKEVVKTTEIREWKSEDTRSIFGNRLERGLIINTEEATPGYTFFNPTNSTESYLMDTDGSIVHSWKGELHTMLSAYLLDNGNVIRLERDPNFPTFAAGGVGGRIREYDWDSNLLWDFGYATDTELIHHDIELLPNGNILAISYEVKSQEEAIAAGFDPEDLTIAGIWPDKIIEIKPTRPSGGEIVWEWHIWDHMVQDIDESKSNYGVVAENPGKLNLNAHGKMEIPHLGEEQMAGMKNARFLTSNQTVDNQGSDITHGNAISYNPQLDQIVFSFKRFGEIYIIDHSTTIEEAKGSTGGKWGHGGDLLYRWGNPQNYDRGTNEDRILFEQHDVKFIPEGFAGAGHLMVFNNDIKNANNKVPEMFEALLAAHSPDPLISIEDIGNHSAAFEFVPPTTDDGSYILPEDGIYGPTGAIWSYTAPDKYSFYSAFISGVYRLANGNTLITSGAQGRLFEVTPEKEIVWEYWNPYNFNYVLPDGGPAQPGNMVYSQFRGTHIPLDHPAFTGKQLAPLDPQPEPFIFKMPPPPPPQEGGEAAH